MIGTAIALGAAGLFLSAFFSGSETGFYRVARTRLVLDALGGDRVARLLLWLANHPSLFIATTLVGNNLANYVTSLAIVLFCHALFADPGDAVTLAAPLLLAPVVFVYGELCPKNLFLHAPNRLLRKGGPLFLLCVPLFFPVSALLWALNRVLARLVRQPPETVRLAIARRELRRVMEEGHQVGILRPAQRELARGIFAVAQDPVSRYVTPLDQIPRAPEDMAKQAAQSLARKFQIPVVLIHEADRPDRLRGYVRVVDLELDPSDQLGPVHPLLKVGIHENHLEVLMQLHSSDEDLAEAVDQSGRTVGIVTAEQLREPLLNGPATPAGIDRDRGP